MLHPSHRIGANINLVSPAVARQQSYRALTAIKELGGRPALDAVTLGRSALRVCAEIEWQRQAWRHVLRKFGPGGKP